jgi:acetyltransferase
MDELTAGPNSLPESPHPSPENPPRRRAPLEAFFRPRSVAVIGATEDVAGVGRSLMLNLQATSFGGTLYAVNPKRSTVLGVACYPNIAAVPEKIDLAVIATPAKTVPGVVRECVAAGVENAIIISAGFKEIGEKGAALEQEIRNEARGKMRIVGPNCLGIMSPHHGLNATFANSMARAGHLGFISQSGALCTAILDWSHRELVGFSAFVSVGSMLDVGWGDLIQYLGDDPETHSIVIYMESVGDARAFLSAAREVALSKPIIVIKPGRTEAGAKAAASHTGSLTGHDEVLDAAFRRCGVIRVNTIAELFNLSEALDKQPRPKGDRLTILTNAGGPAVLATDALLGDGGHLAELSAETNERLNQSLPRHWSHHNPVDILGDANAERYAKTIELALNDPATDGLLVILAPTGLTDPDAVARQLSQYAKSDKPVLASWMGGRDVASAEAILNQAGIPSYGYPDSAARVFQLMWSYTANLKALYQTPESFESEDPQAAAQQGARRQAADLIREARAKGRTLLTEAESKRLLAAYGIPTVRTEVALTAAQAVAFANQIGYPVVLKLHSETLTHKTDVGGVQLNLADKAAVQKAFAAIQDSVTSIAGGEHFLGVTVQPMVRLAGYELILGSVADPQFGPALLFGSGGQLVEVYQDRAIGLPPLNTTLARRLMERTKIMTALRGVRGRKPVNLAELERLLVRFSFLVTEQRWIKEIDINPLLASPDGLLALDARVALFPQDGPEPTAPAIRPYPRQYARPWTFADGTAVMIRPIRPEDEGLMARFHALLSERSILQRYFHSTPLPQRVSHERLLKVCFGDYEREIALVVERRGENGSPEIIALGQLSKAHLKNEAEMGVLIADQAQGRGLGKELSQRLMEIARAEMLDRVRAEMLTGNQQMQGMCRALGFTLGEPQNGVITGIREL